MTTTNLLAVQHEQITALENQLAAAIAALQPFADDYAAAADMFTSEEDQEYMDTFYNAYLQVIAYRARQSTEVQPPGRQPE